MIKPGDVVEVVQHNNWVPLCGCKGRVVCEYRLERGSFVVDFSPHDFSFLWDCGGNLSTKSGFVVPADMLRLYRPLTPFEADLHAYIQRELQHGG